MYYRKQRSLHLFINIVCFQITVITGCTSESKTSDQSTKPEKKEFKYYADWSINTEYILPGCSGEDCIHSIDTPQFISASEATFLEDEELVVGIQIGKEIRCYPHAILNWHEIINDSFEKEKIAINYCPLTGSAMAWDRVINNKITTFGISGLLFNSNVIPYDRENGSYYSQMKQQCVNGENFKLKTKNFPIVETTWKTWRTLFPQTQVLSIETGYERDYNAYPYYTYMEDEQLYFEVEFDNDSLFLKERLFGIIQDEDARVYRFDLFKYGIQIIEDSIFNKNVFVIGSMENNFIVAFENNLNGEKIHIKPNTKFPSGIIEDSNGNIYDVFGNCIDGNFKGMKLNVVNGFIAYWFAWAAFYPEVSIYAKNKNH